ncbi:hypothetical protein ACQ4M3_27510 [Leptolyngbya sp. AN03gr2]|uniref:hypothetical protein n=1 Tax=unclassified Leptolyngbya TaxID=2650499 RepID=UPI003D3198DA
MNRIKEQAAKLWQLLIDPETFGAYRSVVMTTWSILRETGLLLWLVVCLVLVVGEWGSKTAIAIGQGMRDWIDRISSSEQLAPETGKALLEAGKSTVSFTLNQAKSQLGISSEPVQPRVTVSEPALIQPKVAMTMTEE